MKVEKNKFVTINYTLKDDDGNVIDSSVGKEPLPYIHGNNYLLPKLEEQIEGLEEGAKFSTVLEPADGYGERDEKMIAKVPRSNFETDVDIEVGMQFQADTPYGPQIVTVTQVDDNDITIDANHELAGVRLHFDVEVLSVRDATADELNQLNSCSCGGGCGGNCGGGCEGDCGGECGGNCGEEGGCGGGCGNCKN